MSMTLADVARQTDAARMAATALLALLCAACGGGGGGGGVIEDKDPEPSGIAPAAILDLSRWQLTLPVDAQGGTQGPAATVRTQALLDGYEAQWFYGSQDDGVTFWVPVDGALTPNASFPRSELRQMLDPEDGSVNWSRDDTAELTALLEVNQVPSENGKVTVGQVLGYNGEDPDISVLGKLVFEDNPNGRATLYALVYPSPYAPGSSAERLVIVGNLRRNEPFRYTIRVAERRILFAMGEQSVSAPIDSSWADVGLYFRAGAALHVRGTSAADGARVSFFDLRQSHGV